MLGLPRKLESAVELAWVTTLIYTRHNGIKATACLIPSRRPRRPEPT